MSKQTDIVKVSQGSNGDPLYIDTVNNSVGVGTSSIQLADTGRSVLEVNGSTNSLINLKRGDANSFYIQNYSTGVDFWNSNNTFMRFVNNSSEAMRIDSSGNLLVGKTTDNITVVGAQVQADGALLGTRANGQPMTLNRTSSDGDIVQFRKDGTTVGSIATYSSDLVFAAGGDCGIRLNHTGATGSDFVAPARDSGALRDNAIDLGTASGRWDDVYATNGVIQTSDVNEKQQIAELTAAEMQAAKAISKLFKTFKWNDSVVEKGDDARIHTGVIAQEVEAAMTAAGLDAGRYAFFISSDWTDEETGEQRNRKGIRYPQLLSFIGAATEQRLASIEARLDALEAN